MRYVISGALALGLVVCTLTHARGQANGSRQPVIRLKENWRIQSSAQVKAAGDVISTPQYKTTGWYPTSVPSTVLAALVENKLYWEPYFGMNLRAVPGCSYPVGANFSNLPMPDDSPFRSSWWYRTEFLLPESERGRAVWLRFD